MADLGDETREGGEGAAGGADHLHELVKLHDARQVRLQVLLQRPAAAPNAASSVCQQVMVTLTCLCLHCADLHHCWGAQTSEGATSTVQLATKEQTTERCMLRHRAAREHMTTPRGAGSTMRSLCRRPYAMLDGPNHLSTWLSCGSTAARTDKMHIRHSAWRRFTSIDAELLSWCCVTTGA